MRRPKSAWSTAIAAIVLSTANPGMIARAQTSTGISARGADSAASASSGATSRSSARNARHLLRNGQDYLDLGEYERAIDFLKEAENRQFELSADERKVLQQAIFRARQGLRGVDVAAKPSARPARGMDRITASRPKVERPGAVALAVPSADERVLEPDTVRRVADEQSTADPRPSVRPLRKAEAEADDVALPPLPDAEPAPAPAPAPRALPARADADETAPPMPVALSADSPAGRSDRSTDLAMNDPAPSAEPSREPAPVDPPAEEAPRPAVENPAKARGTAADPILLESLPDPNEAQPVAPVATASAVDAPKADASAVPTNARADEPTAAAVETPTSETATPSALPADSGEVMIIDEPAEGSPTTPAAKPVQSAPASIPAAVKPASPVRSEPKTPAAAPLPESTRPAAVAPEIEAVAPVDPPIPQPNLVPVDEPKPEAEPQPAPAPAPVAEAAPTSIAPLPVDPPATEPTPSATPATAPPIVEPSSPTPSETRAAAERIARGGADPRSAAEAASPPPAAAEEVALPPLPTGTPTTVPVAAPTSAPAAISPTVSDAKLPDVKPLPDEVKREVERIARLQQEDARRNPPPAIGSPGTPGGPTTSDDLSGARLELPRAPSPTEIRPIRAIPIPEEFVPLEPRKWDPSRKVWTAAATCHGPLYFQDAVLERYGQGVEQALGPAGRFFSYPLDDIHESNQRNQILQPFFSIGLFASQIVLWPYNLVVDPPWEAEYDLGYYRPGDRVPEDTIYLPTTGVGPPLRGRRY